MRYRAGCSRHDNLSSGIANGCLTGMDIRKTTDCDIGAEGLKNDPLRLEGEQDTESVRQRRGIAGELDRLGAVGVLDAGRS